MIIYLYCDGACRGNPGPGAWACIGENEAGEQLFEASSVEFTTTNNRMELAGAIFGLSWVEKNQGQFPSPLTQVILSSDSKYLVDGAGQWLANWKKRGWKKSDKTTPENLDLWQQIDRLLQVLVVKFVWVRGHDGHCQNEYCDQLANTALDQAGF